MQYTILNLKCTILFAMNNITTVITITIITILQWRKEYLKRFSKLLNITYQVNSRGQL